MSEDIGMQVTRLLMTNSPGLLNNDTKANAEACLALSDVLGFLLATLKVKRGQAYYEKAARVVFERIDASAKATFAKAHDIAAEGPEAVH